MCGFAGARHREPIAAERLEKVARAMQAALHHRGPDMTGQWLEPTGRAVFSFNRLAIQDLSPAANQPMHSARDRMGKKPLHYELRPGDISFASEIKALLAASPHPRSTSAEAVRAFFSLTYVPAPLSIFESIRKVRPGHILEVDRNWNVREWPYWSLRAVLEARERGAPAREEIIEHAAALLEDAVRRRLISDVPVAVLLSGG